jgi:uncharacterized surface protein with fasciclin (FAS1) repeats
MEPNHQDRHRRSNGVIHVIDAVIMPKEETPGGIRH